MTTWVAALVVAAYASLAIELTLLHVASVASSRGIWSAPADLVDSSSVSRAINVNSAQAQVAKTVGPCIAGIVLAQFGAVWAFGANAATSLFAAIAIFAIRHCVSKPIRERRSVRNDLQRGWKAVRDHPSRRFVVASIGIAMFLCAPLYQSIAAVNSDHLHLGAAWYGFFVGLYGAGAVLGNVLKHRLTTTPGHLLAYALTIQGLAMNTTVIAHSPVVVALAITLSGLCSLLTTVTLMTSIQLMTPAHLRGRVVAIYSFAYVGGMPLGNLVQGWSTQHYGLVPTVVTAGIVVSAIGMAMWRRSDLRRHIDGTAIDVIDLETKVLTAQITPAPRLHARDLPAT